jgi:hypothetical protein
MPIPAEFPNPRHTHGAAMGYSDAAPSEAITDALLTRTPARDANAPIPFFFPSPHKSVNIHQK